MPAQANANVVALQLEKVRDKVPLLYERDDILLIMIQQRGDVEKVSSRNMRLPLQVNPGGKAGSYNADGGDLGRGSGTAYDVAQVSPIFFRFAIEITKLVEYATNGRERAVENAAKREVANGMKQFRAFLDKLMQTAGNGVLGTINSIASTTFTMAVPGGAVANDVIVHDGLSGAQPVSLFGIKYHHNAATTGTWLNLNRATYPVQLQTPRVNAGNAALTPSNVRLAINKVRKSLGINHVSKLIAYMAVEQEHAWENLGITVSQIIKEGGNGDGNDLDLLFSGRKTMSGIPIKYSANADQTRVDFLDLSHWGRAVLKDIDFYEVNGNTVFPIYGASGGLAASFIFYFDTAFQVWDDSPRTGAFIDTLARPSGSSLYFFAWNTSKTSPSCGRWSPRTSACNLIPAAALSSAERCCAARRRSAITMPSSKATSQKSVTSCWIVATRS